MSGMGRLPSWLVAAALAGAVTSPGAAEQPAGTPAPGRLVERIACAASPAHTYTLFLPANYTPERAWPVLFVFDPRGRATAAAEIFKPGAERFGWIVISSNDTRSDAEDDPNGPAIRALWIEAARYAVDERRIYLAAFSGLVNSAWAVAANTGHVAGIIASGGRVHPDVYGRTMTAAFFGTAGLQDFNFLQMKMLDGLLARRGADARRLEFFEGQHGWLPAPLAEEGMAWLEVVAMAEKRRALDTALVAERLAADRQAAEGLERGGRLLDAARRFEAIARTYGGLQDVTFASQRAKALNERRDVARALDDERRWDDWEARAVQRGQALLRVVPDPDMFPSVGQVASELQLAELRRQADRKDYAAGAAQRVLSTFFVDASYYQWRAALREGSARRALFVQRVALEIDPDVPSAWYRLAIAAATAGDKRQALDALERAEKLGLAAADLVQGEEAFAKLRGDARYEQVLARMRERAKAQ
jgi:hypothetical protein